MAAPVGRAGVGGRVSCAGCGLNHRGAAPARQPRVTGLSDNGRMKIQLLSDLHLEANPSFVPVPAPHADLLVLAGDIGSYQTRRDGSVMNEPDWGLQRFSPLPQYAGWPTPVVFVPGNHEYDALDVDEAHADMRKVCERLGIQWLERET
eukprot:gene22306-42569_t